MASKPERKLVGLAQDDDNSPNKSSQHKGDNKEEASTSTPSPSPSPLPVPIQRQPPNKNKYKIHLVAVGSAPMLKKTKFLLSAQEEFSTLTGRLRKMLKLKGADTSLFLYINQSFVPSPTDLIGDLGDLFSVRDELQIHYSLQEAFY